MKNLTKVALLASLGFAGQLLATEFRAPIATTNGPLYYSFDKLHKKKSNFTMWSVGEARESSEAYIKHGTSTHPLGQLFFGKDKFTIGESFQDAQATKWGITEGYNPYLDLTKIAPRVSYSERGVIWGASWDYPVWKNAGRIGLRASVPFKYVRLERDEQAEDAELGIQEHVVKGDQRYVRTFYTTPPSNANPYNTLGHISSYRLKLLNNLLWINNAGSVVTFYNVAKENRATIDALYNKSNDYSTAANTYGSGEAETKIPFVVIKAAQAGKAPHFQGGALLVDLDTGNPIAQETNKAGVLYGNSDRKTGTPPALPATYKLEAIGTTGSNIAYNASAPKAYVFTNQDYSKLNYLADPNSINEDWWVTTIHGLNTAPIPTSQSTVNNIDDLLLHYTFEVTDWLQERGFQMMSNEDTSFGDITADLFYEHTFNDNWRGELCFGVKFPSGNGGSNYGVPMHNAYRVQTGNGSHWELKLGAWGAWQAIDWMNIKLDVEANFALEKTEHRCAAYKGAHVKNFGPKEDAEVDWFYFIGNLDFNFTHPKTKKIKGLIGYQFYYKTEDHIDFKKSKDTTWLGQVWADASGNRCVPNTTALGTQFVDLTMELDGHVARMDTEAFAHRVRLEGAYTLSKYITVAVGGLYTFAGQNIPAEADIHAGCNVRF